ncbi:DNA-binding transcriptional regulator LsrR, DeoR family [Virgibacillus subterraneus]|uniref:DNA-binding transcriptional regulator LsrR, DeoR family n=1 Tax=Virgibacillus subterraneus TaxID=621109 RepID=A0A1H9AQ61_9BACI|nr:sugar-binding transcriptional regulator [Virgibacillus subterraneus]SEP78906.1 DNA-binding transcriptional regulator LsrR, DeoR family [Virgibacillus subterraneus]
MEKERLRFMVTICEEYYHEGLNQQEIAKKHGISRPQVSRMISAAKTEGIVEVNVRNPFSNEMTIEKELMKRFQLNNVIVVDSTDVDNRPSDTPFAIAGAIYLEGVIKRGGAVGVMAGKSIASVVSEINETQQSDTHFVPLIGGWGLNDTNWHANTCVTQLSRKTKGDCWVLHAPAMVSSDKLYRNLMDEPQIKKVISLANNVETAVVGIGEISESATFFNSMQMEKYELKKLKKEGAVASIGTSFINSYGEEIDLHISKRMIGISGSNLKAIPLVVGLARGIAKVDAIHASLKGEWIDVLITDMVTAEQILEKEKWEETKDEEN